MAKLLGLQSRPQSDHTSDDVSKLLEPFRLAVGG
jgi:hypothetical protein